MWKNLCGLWLMLLIVMAGDVTGSEPNFEKPVIRLPTILQQYNERGDDEKPEITIEELSKCMGDDYNLQKKVNDFRKRQAGLKNELNVLEQDFDAIQPTVEYINSHTERLNVSVSKMNQQYDDIKQQQAEIERRKSALKPTNKEVKETNKLIKKMGADLRRYNEQRSELVLKQEKFKKEVAAYNEQRNELIVRNNRFNEKKQQYDLSLDQFNKKIAEYTNKCKGDRKSNY